MKCRGDRGSSVSLLREGNCGFFGRGRGSRDALHPKDGFDGQGRRKTAVSDTDTGDPISTNPPDFPASIFTLQRQKSAKVDVIAQSKVSTNAETH